MRGLMQLREGTGEKVKRRLFIRCFTTYGNSIVMCPKVGYFLTRV